MAQDQGPSLYAAFGVGHFGQVVDQESLTFRQTLAASEGQHTFRIILEPY